MVRDLWHGRWFGRRAILLLHQLGTMHDDDVRDRWSLRPKSLLPSPAGAASGACGKKAKPRPSTCVKVRDLRHWCRDTFDTRGFSARFRASRISPPVNEPLEQPGSPVDKICRCSTRWRGACAGYPHGDGLGALLVIECTEEQQIRNGIGISKWRRRLLSCARGLRKTSAC